MDYCTCRSAMMTGVCTCNGDGFGGDSIGWDIDWGKFEACTCTSIDTWTHSIPLDEKLITLQNLIGLIENAPIVWVGGDREMYSMQITERDAMEYVKLLYELKGLYAGGQGKRSA